MTISFNSHTFTFKISKFINSYTLGVNWKGEIGNYMQRQPCLKNPLRLFNLIF